MPLNLKTKRAFAPVFNTVEDAVKEAGAITWLQDGAITQNRFKERTVPTFPTATMQMEQFAQEIVKRIIGLFTWTNSATGHGARHLHIH